jgi:hypothetical protein
MEKAKSEGSSSKESEEVVELRLELLPCFAKAGSIYILEDETSGGGNDKNTKSVEA